MPKVADRRVFIAAWLNAIIGGFAARRAATGQHPGGDLSQPLKVKLVKEFRSASIRDVSPDGKKVCLYFTKSPQETYLWRGTWTRRTPSRARDRLKVIEIATQRETYLTPLMALAMRATFFDSNQEIYVETISFRTNSGLMKQHVLINLATGQREEQLRPDALGLTASYRAIDGSYNILGTEFDDSIRQATALVSSSLPSYWEIRRASFRPVNRRISAVPRETEIVLSADRRTFAYEADGWVVCRKTADLEILWIQQAPVDLPAWRVAVSAAGERVCVAFCEATLRNLRRRYHVTIYDGATGGTIAVLPVNGTEGIAISPDLRYLAVGNREDLDTNGTQVEMTVAIYDIASGRRVARLIHDRLRIVRGKASYGSFAVIGIQFTSDGKYLISSGVDTKIWEL